MTIQLCAWCNWFKFRGIIVGRLIGLQFGGHKLVISHGICRHCMARVERQLEAIG